MTLDELLRQRAELVEARATGATRIVFSSGGTRREIEYKSDFQMAAALAAIDGQIAALSGRRVTTFLPTFKTGFDD